MCVFVGVGSKLGNIVILCLRSFRWAHTRVLDLSSCFGLTGSILEKIAQHCLELQTLVLQVASVIITESVSAPKLYGHNVLL